MVCEKMKPAVSGLEKEFEGQVKAENVDAMTPESKKVIAELGFKNHGLVVRAPDGTVVHKQPDHAVDIALAKKAIAEILAAK